MSFLVPEDDKSLLTEAFAFIEAFGGENSPVGVDTADSSSGLDDVPTLDDLIEESCLELQEGPAVIEGPDTAAVARNSPTTQTTDGKDQKPKQKPTKKRRVRSAETSWTGLQRRKRAELASLREQTEELENLLAQLKHASGLPLSPGKLSG